MHTNERFRLSESLLAELTAWTNERCRQYWDEGAGSSFEVAVTFSFGYFGHRGVATVDSETLVLEDDMDDVRPPWRKELA